ncbi:MAG: hydantoinase/oxoprolinase family protein [Chloroflexota bacterium]|nr:MAG: hydantoinase/oxoprolinase family protein [Chloroflexota bacterium]
MRLGVDIGGTFTDFVFYDGSSFAIHKLPTTPTDPSRALLQGVRDLEVPQETVMVHGTTVATNALLERQGARTALLTTAGFADLLEIGRQTRPSLYDLEPRRPEPLVPARWRYEVEERVSSQGMILTPLRADDLLPIACEMAREGIQSVAICFLFSFLHPAHERTARDALLAASVWDGQAPFVSLSSEVLPEYREYERLSTVVINAYVSPLLGDYLINLEQSLGRSFWVMQSNGGSISSQTARAEGVRTVLSGPAGGVLGAHHVAQGAGFANVITLDMGGTSTDISLCPGYIQTTADSTIGGLPLRIPTISIHTIGAGGGSIAQVDAGGALMVGPQSAGADPGPACYGRGTQATVTDANLVLGRLQPDYFLGGHMRLDLAAAERAISAVAGRMGCGALAAAEGIVRVANSSMERAIRVVSVERGFDPRDFALLAFGGAGPLHACDLAAEMRIPTVLIPRRPGVLSALGMIVADVARHYSRTIMRPAAEVADAELDAIFLPLERQAMADLTAEGVPPERIALVRSLDMRYVGESYELTISMATTAPTETPRGTVLATIAEFHRVHESRYSHSSPEAPTEVVNLRLDAIGRVDKPLETLPAGEQDLSVAHLDKRPVYFGGRHLPTPLYDRDHLAPGARINGPAVLVQEDSTVVVPPRWTAEVDGQGNLIAQSSADGRAKR